MTTPQPARFDNYPAEPDPGSAGFDEPSDDLPRRAIPPGPESHLFRRTAIGLLLGVPTLCLAVVVLGRQSAESSSPRPTPPAPTIPSPATSAPPTPVTTPERPASASRTKVNAGGHSATVPAGWTIYDNRADEVALSAGDNRVIAYQFFAAEADKAQDLVRPLTRTRLGNFKGSLKLDEHYEIETNYQYAGAWAEGTVRGKKASLYASLWIGWGDGDALLVITILTAISGSETEREANAMVREFAVVYP